MKAILISTRPERVAKTLNGEKKIEIRSSAPKDWMDYLSGKTKAEPKPRTAYLYCTKSNDYELDKTPESGWFFVWEKKGSEAWIFNNHCEHEGWFNGKVVAKVTLRKVEEIKFRLLTKTNSYGYKRIEPTFTTQTLSSKELKKLSCLTGDDLMNYLNVTDGYAWHISDLEIFDEPKGLNIFLKPNWDKGLDKELERARKEDLKIIKRIENGKAFDDEIPNCEELTLMGFELSGLIKKAPRSWRYVEVEE